jgi:hypothetical protein
MLLVCVRRVFRETESSRANPIRPGVPRPTSLQPSLGRGSVRKSVQPGGGRQMRMGAGGTIPGTGNVGHCALPRRARSQTLGKWCHLGEEPVRGWGGRQRFSALQIGGEGLPLVEETS